MKDAFGHEINVGDFVSFMEPGYAYEQKVGIVTRMTKQKIVIIWNQQWTMRNGNINSKITESYKFPEQVAKGTPADKELIEKLEYLKEMTES